MAVKLNKNRIQESWLLFAACILIFLFTRPMAAENSITHEALDTIGFSLVIICAIGRIYTTAFLGGYKNTKLITYGPFSIVRNPLYVFTFIGVLGVSICTLRIGVIAIAPIGLAIVYHYLVKREESFLLEKFGDDYANYLVNVPRFIPNFSKFYVPESIEMTPRRMFMAVIDSLWWFAAFGIIEFFEKFNM